MSRDQDVLDLWLDGRYAGQLFRGETGLVEFLYDEAYRSGPAATPLSVSMPKADRGHGPDRVMPWLSNLLPDAVEVRDRWAAKFGEGRRGSDKRTPGARTRHELVSAKAVGHLRTG